MLKKVSETYAVGNGLTCITVNKEVDFSHVSVHEGSEPCSGILRHWGNPKDLIAELKDIIKALEAIK